MALPRLGQGGTGQVCGDAVSPKFIRDESVFQGDTVTLDRIIQKCQRSVGSPSFKAPRICVVGYDKRHGWLRRSGRKVG